MSLPLPAARRIGTPTMLAYAVGAVAYGVKDNGFGTFLLLFYNQVVGLPSATVGLVVMAALVLDAMIDPAVGVLSDRTRGRWGRRHPWMYAAALPIAIGWMLLWHPPAGWAEPALLAWLFVTAVAVRSAVSCYEVPSVALTPELSTDYDERTRIMAYRYLFGWMGGLAMLLAAYTVFLVPSGSEPNGLLNRAGYANYAIAGAVIMAAAILISALGTHRQIPRLPQAGVVTTSIGGAFREMLQSMNNRGFAILMLGGLTLYTNQGISFALSNYLYTYVWRFETSSFVALTGTLFAGVAVAFLAAPRVGKATSKPRAASLLVLAGTALLVLPYVLRLAGWFPAPGSPVMLPLLFAIFTINTACSVSGMILAASMMADVVEASEAETGRRSEGVFFAGSFFIQKCTSGVGIFAAGAILALAGFPAAAKPGLVPLATIDRLTIVYVAIYATLGCVTALVLSRFPFGRGEHAARLERLAAG